MLFRSGFIEGVVPTVLTCTVGAIVLGGIAGAVLPKAILGITEVALRAIS